MVKIAIIVSHPIQHFCPQYASYSKLPNTDFKIIFGSRLGVDSYTDTQFNQSIKWENLYLEEFNHVFLNEQVLPSNKVLDSENLEEELEAFNPEIIISYGYFQKLQKRAYQWAITNNKKIAYISDSELLRKRPIGVNFLKKIYLNKYFSKINAFLSVGDANESYYNYYGVPLDKMFRTSFPIDIRTFNIALEKVDIIKERIKTYYNIEKDSIVISTVGKLLDFKRHIDVINALLKLDLSLKYKITYIIIGDGPESNNLKYAASKLKNHSVVFAGFIKPQHLPDFYITSDFYIHPSSTEAHSLAISEAVFASCPILISDRCGSYGPTDDVQSGLNGFVFETGNVTQIARYIEKLSIDINLRKKFSSASKSIGNSNQYLAHGGGLLKALNTLMA